VHKNRLVYIDNLRLLVIILVIITHLIQSYTSMGNWFYKQPNEVSFYEIIFFLYYLSFTQAYFMGLLFLISGYFTPSSYDKKGYMQFLKERLIRLGTPALIFMLILYPIIVIIRTAADGFSLNAADIFTNYFKYIISIQFLAYPGPLWFTLTVMVFSIIYAYIRKILDFIKRFIPIKPSAGSSVLTIKKIIMIILIISASSFLVRIVQPIGSIISSMQYCYFAQYIVFFILGIKCKRNNWFEKFNYSAGKKWFISAHTIGLIFYTVIMILGGAFLDYQPFNGGFTWQSAAYSIWESYVGVSVSIGLIAITKEKFNKQNKLVKTMSDDAFSVYVFHTPIIVLMSVLFFTKITGIIPLVKLFLLIITAIPICFLVMHFTVRKIPILRKLLE